jgi:cytoskeleton protein RodZ
LSQNSLGIHLREEREKKGITIEQVASATKVSVRLLHALEADQYSDLPAAPFVRGFVTSYCRFVGLDDKDVLTRFKQFISEKSMERPSREGGHSGYAFDKQGEERSRTVLWASMGSFVVVGGILMFFLRPALKHRGSHLQALRSSKTADVADEAKVATPGSSETAKPGESAAADKPTDKSATVADKAPEKKPEKVADKAKPSPKEKVADVKSGIDAPETTPVPQAPAPAATPAPASTPNTAQPTSKSAGGTEVVASSAAKSQTPAQMAEKDPMHKGDDLAPAQVKQKVVFRSKENIWVRYRVDEREPHQFMLLKDKQLVLKAERQIRFQVSNPKAIEMRYKTGAYQTVDGANGLSEHNATPTLVFPPQDAEKIGEPFPGMNALPSTPDPGASTASTST